jgi:hypothetical protein
MMMSTAMAVSPMMMTATVAVFGERSTTADSQHTQDSDHSQHCATEHDVLSFSFFRTLLNQTQPHGIRRIADPVPIPENRPHLELRRAGHIEKKCPLREGPNG